MNLDSHCTPEGRFAFHITDRENVASIREHGLRQSAACNTDTKTTTEALASRGYEDAFPFDRSAVVYCYINKSVIEEYAEMDELRNDDVAIVIDLDLVSAPLYLANMSAASEFIDHDVAPDIAPATDTFEEAVRQYRESIVRLGGTEVVPNWTSIVDGTPAMVVKGDVPVEAIAEIRRL